MRDVHPILRELITPDTWIEALMLSWALVCLLLLAADMATILPFPIVTRPVPVEASPLYRRGVRDTVAAILRVQQGYSPDGAQARARLLADAAFAKFGYDAADGLPCNAGEGEAS